MDVSKVNIKTKYQFGDIVLLKHEMNVAQKLFNLVQDNKNYLKQFLPWAHHSNKLEDQVNYLEMANEAFINKDMFDFGIYIDNSKTLIGCIGIHSISYQNKRCEIGYWLGEKYNGQGYITKIINQLKIILINDIGFNRIEIRCNKKNQKSSNVPKRCDFKLDGVLRQDTLEFGKLRDTLVFSFLKEDLDISLV